MKTKINPTTSRLFHATNYGLIVRVREDGSRHDFRMASCHYAEWKQHVESLGHRVSERTVVLTSQTR